MGELLHLERGGWDNFTPGGRWMGELLHFECVEWLSCYTLREMGR